MARPKGGEGRGILRPRGHTELVRGLAASARAGTLPHALLFTGEEGIGKFQAAIWLAATLLCESGADEPCLTCGPCRRVANRSHADLFTVEHRAHGQNQITVHFVATREPRPKDGYQGPPVEEFLALRAAEGRGKFVIVREAEAMSEEAQNAFLKTLEEPRPGVHIVLECSSPGSLLATVRSRVVPVRLESLGADACAEILFDQGEFAPGEDDGRVSELVRLSGGSPGLALRLERRAAPAMLELLAAAFTGERSGAAAVEQLFELDGDFPGKTASAQRRTRARMALDLGLGLLTDLERVHAGAEPGDLPHGPAAARVAVSAFARSPSRRRAAAEGWLTAREDLNLNLAPEALVERALASLR